MRIRVLGCSGGIGADTRTTALLVDDDILIDAGTGVGDLDVAALRAIDHVFLTHAHLDHVVSVPFLVDTVGAQRDRPLTVHAQEATLSTLWQNIFNWHVWPDFTQIPNKQRPYLRFEALAPGAGRELGGRRLTSVPVEHAVPAVGYLVSGARGSLAFSGDTTENDGFWQALNACRDLRQVIIETSFTDADEELSRLSKHLCPKMLKSELAKLKRPAEIYITHLMPDREDQIMAEIRAHLPGNPPRALKRGMVFEL
ncbi:MAG TPA: 3',5'-cyclic-nucleotide phosphodiesterase [Acidiferrobacterales bacterium]